MNISNTDVYGFTHAMRAMRNPLSNWELGDSLSGERQTIFNHEGLVGPKDKELMLKLAKRGSSHRKFLRQIKIWVTLNFPIYGWSEFDTYKVGVTRLSCSTMHRLGHRNLTRNDFQKRDVLPAVLKDLNQLGREFRKQKAAEKKGYYNLVRKMKRRLPSGYLQQADLCLSYEAALNIFLQRHDHRLEEWRFNPKKLASGINERGSICDWIYSLPFMPEIIKATGLEV